MSLAKHRGEDSTDRQATFLSPNGRHREIQSDFHQERLRARVLSSGIVISGIREWHTAVSEGRRAVKCTEYQLSDDEALEMILILQQSRGAWNAFTRVQIALQQESYLQAKAHANQVVGGKDKGWANLPEARQIEVRQEIAYLAGACPRNVSKS